MRQAIWAPALLAALVVVVLIVGAMFGRVLYPYDLEWMEGGQLAHGWRVLHGLPLYPEPGPDWIPYIYPPGHATLLAGVGGLFGLSAPVGRVISWVGTALACGSIATLVVRQSQGPSRWIGGVLGAACYLTCWVPGGTFHDLVRPDALAIGLMLASLVCALERSVALQVLGGVLLALAFWFKHPMAAFGLPLTLGLWVRDGTWRAALRVGSSALVPAVIAVGIQQALEPAFLTYLLAVPASHPVVAERMFPLTPWELGAALPFGACLVGFAALRALPREGSGLKLGVGIGIVAVVLGTLALLLPAMPVPAVGVVSGSAALVVALAVVGVALVQSLRGQHLPKSLWLGVGLGATALLLAAWMRGHVGGFTNVHLPLFAITSVGIGWAISTCRLPSSIAVVSLGLAAQFAFAAWSIPVDRLVPTAGDELTGDRLVEALRGVEGPVWSPISPYLPVLAGHPPGPHQIALWDVANHPDGPWPQTRRGFREAVAEQRWGAVVVGERSLRFGVKKHYQAGPWVKVDPAFRPRWGWGDRPTRVWLPAPRGGVDGDAGPQGR